MSSIPSGRNLRSGGQDFGGSSFTQLGYYEGAQEAGRRRLR